MTEKADGRESNNPIKSRISPNPTSARLPASHLLLRNFIFFHFITLLRHSPAVPHAPALPPGLLLRMGIFHLRRYLLRYVAAFHFGHPPPHGLCFRQRESLLGIATSVSGRAYFAYDVSPVRCQALTPCPCTPQVPSWGRLGYQPYHTTKIQSPKAH